MLVRLFAEWMLSAGVGLVFGPPPWVVTWLFVIPAAHFAWSWLRTAEHRARLLHPISGRTFSEVAIANDWIVPLVASGLLLIVPFTPVASAFESYLYRTERFGEPTDNRFLKSVWHKQLADGSYEALLEFGVTTLPLETFAAFVELKDVDAITKSEAWGGKPGLLEPPITVKPMRVERLQDSRLIGVISTHVQNLVPGELSLYIHLVSNSNIVVSNCSLGRHAESPRAMCGDGRVALIGFSNVDTN
jgi:hypothetical protein